MNAKVSEFLLQRRLQQKDTSALVDVVLDKVADTIDRMGPAVRQRVISKLINELKAMESWNQESL